MRNDFFSQSNLVKLKNFKEIKVVKMYETGITILTLEDLIWEKKSKKTHEVKMSAMSGHGDGVGVNVIISKV